ncbi:hypothetical protein BAE44_0011577, partial [Dichanthelium oligosanthes]
LGLLEWWQKELAELPRKTRRTKAALLMYSAWNIWKERNRRIFEHRHLTAVQVEQEIKTEIMTSKMACGSPELPVVS